MKWIPSSSRFPDFRICVALLVIRPSRCRVPSQTPVCFGQVSASGLTAWRNTSCGAPGHRHQHCCRQTLFARFHVARVHVHSFLLHMAPFMQQGIGILHTVSSSYVYQLMSAWTLLSRFPATVSIPLTVQNDDSGILSVIPSALFIF